MAEGKQIYAFGDYARDTILIVKSDRGDGNQTRGNRERLTRSNMKKYEVKCGITVLEGLFRAFSQDEDNLPDENTADRRKPVSETISEWEEGNDKDTKGHYYLRQQTGYAKNKETTEVDIDRICEKNIVAIYNMESKQYTKENGESGTHVDVGDIAEALTKTSACVIRSGWILPGSKYSPKRPPEPTDLLLKILENGATAEQPNTILVVNIEELRRCGYNIREGISWEQLVLETKQAVEKTRIKGTQITECCKAVLVCIKHEGCLLFYQGKTYLFYYCDKIEDDFAREKKHAVFGSTSVMQAVITQGLSEKGEKSEEEALCNSVKYGLALMRELLNWGYQMVRQSEEQNDRLAFPYDHIGWEYRELQNEKSEERKKYNIIKSVEFGKEDLEDKDSITRRFLRGNYPSVADGVLNECRNFVESGVETASIPYLKLGKLITFDREEVEHIRSIQRIVEQYKDDPGRKTPLSLCVFGRPGSGKSFAVKQIVKELGVKPEDIFEFNLSQMADVQDLYDAFHQIRDAGLRSGLPVAFFDEFDASIGNTELGWLKYFLAPMQDGEFREHGVTHYIGKALFVFAGGTCQAMGELRKKQTQPEMVQQKLPDFLSRVKGYIDVAGPNAIPCPVVDKPENCWMKAGLLMTREEEPGLQIEDYEREYISHCYHKTKCCQDLSHYLRRAALLRSQLEQKLGKPENGEKYKINGRVLDAFLRTGQYKHGARSLTAIVETSHLEPGRPFDVTSIDSNFLDLYATDDFKRYLRQPPKPDKQSN